ncbi:alpha-L-fucosidase [Streptomyces sp. RB6PN25]|uniref:alpha-L-fucosidase n=1 Tax=Streptomyces humicola TaxID=2953240 RepID=A0ABT1PUU4_9ACTN|nr:alpha-L-fucosidase [Streptomyces humicola]MCQ4081448.1 alpha-L-fucosidase [Streptomyces humicola]
MQDLPRRQVLGTALGAAVATTLATGGSALAAPAATDARMTQTTDDPGAGTAWGSVPPAVPVPLDSYFNNNAIDTATTHDGNFDGSGYAFPGEQLPSGTTAIGGVPFAFSSSATSDNNVVALGQHIALPAPGTYLSAQFLLAGSYGDASGTVTVSYADGSTSQADLTAPDWYSSGGSGAVNATFRYTPTGTDQHPVSISTAELWIDPSRKAVAVTLPTTAQPAANTTSMHIFALTLQPTAQGRALMLRTAASTNSLLDPRTQSVEATVVNAGSVWIDASDQVQAAVTVDGARTVTPASITTLAPGEEARVRIGIRSTPGTAPGTARTGTVAVTGRGAQAAALQTGLTLGTPDYQPTDVSLETHQAPYWFDDAKFGIFIHWGVYSVPAWGPVGKEYAEWYWDHMQDPNDPTYAYHKQTYGEDFAYDQFIPRFTAQRFDPRSWVELFRDAGAQYFVLTSKHHEGFALWDTKVTDRNAVKLGPHRDLVRELFDASRTYTPQLHNGLYYSLPEWFNPANPWMGHAPRNPYTLQPVPYTGYIPVNDYVADYQTPQVLELINGYDPDIIWFDIGGVNDSLHTMADYLNHAKNRPMPKDVTYDNRGGIAAHDFTTPEYTTYKNTVVAKWEASRGLDPFSYGYNSATPDSDYMTAEQVVQTLVDIVSKNGNFLLDIGPKADGTIPDIMRTRLRQTGQWLAINGESVYGTTYWSKMAQLGNLRFTIRQGPRNPAFYISSLGDPGSTLVVQAPVPVRKGDKVTMLGYNQPLDWEFDGETLTVQVPAAARMAGQYAWVFKIAWSGG